MGVIVISIYIQSAFFCDINKNKTTQSFLRKDYILLKPTYRELSWPIKIKSCIFEEIQ